jgi:TRAP-type C4-dicarboxylate transport system permease large subunit
VAADYLFGNFLRLPGFRSMDAIQDPESGNSPLQNMPFLLVLVVVMFIIMLLPDFTLFLANLLWK